MKSFAFRILCSFTLATLLAACGGGTSADMPTQTAAAVQTNISTATMPAPDCGADGCKGLRVIDANAEAYRYDAMRRAEAPQS
jgi:hypothetical protein